MSLMQSQIKNRQLNWLPLCLLVLLATATCVLAETIDLNSSPSILIQGAAAGDGTGFDVASGDFNGDGIDDMLLGAFKSAPGGRSQAGRVYVVYGASSISGTIDLSTSADITIEGAVVDDRLGRAVAAGDVNGDGIEDIIIGAPGSDPGARVDAGRVYVIYGAASLASTIDLSVTSADLEVQGKNASDLLGRAMATGDINGDGVPDLVIGVPRAEVGSIVNAGETVIIYGDSTLPAIVNLNTTAPDVVLEGKVNSDESGNKLAVVDMNGDGFDDVIVGASNADPNGNNSGAVYVVYGGNSLANSISLSAANMTIMGAAANNTLGSSLSSGDVNRDGYGDLIVGAPGASPGGVAFAGRTYVFYGSASLPLTLNLLTQSADVTVSGAELYDSHGWSVSATNFNGDGFSDIVSAASFASPLARGFAGRVYGIYGAPSLPAIIDTSTVDLNILGDQANDNAGYDVASGDINGDGVEDIIIGAQGASPGGKLGAGAVYVAFGTPPYLEVSVTSTSASYGQPLTLSVNIDSTSGMLLAESGMSISFNRDLLTFTGLDNSGTLTSAWTLGSTIAVGSVEPVDTLKATAVNTGAPVTTKGEFLRLNFFVNKLRNAITAPVTLVRLTFNGGEPGWNQTSAGQITLLGNDGTVEATVVSEPGDTVGVRVNDVDLNIDTLGVEIFSATLQNSRTGESEVIVITEQSFNDDVFFGKLPTIFGAGAGANDDGTMNAQAGDTLFVQYDDPLSAAGPVNTLLDTHQVVVLGDADGSGALQAFDGALILSHAAGHALLTGRDSLVANLDANAPYGSITAFDAALAIQRRLGMIARFPVQESSSANHPQPETGNNAKPVVEERFLALQPQVDFVAVQLEDRSEIIAADLVLEGIEGRVEMAAEMELFEMVYHNAEDGLHVSFAGPRPLSGNGELFRIYPTDTKAQVQTLSGTFNGGRIVARLHGAQPLTAQPLRFALHENIPNPFNAETLIRFDLPSGELASLDVFNAFGQKVRTLVQGRLDAGSHQLRWDSRDDRGATLASGVYFYRLVAGERVQTQRMMLVK